MAGKRHKGIRRTVSISTMGLGSDVSETPSLSEYSKVKQKAPSLPSHSPHPAPASNRASRHQAKPPLIDVDALLAKTTPRSQLSPNVKNSGNTTLRSAGSDESERKYLGLGVVAALSNESDASTGAKDGKREAPPPCESKNIVNCRVSQLVPPELWHRNMDMQKPSAIFLHEWTCNDDYDDLVCTTLPTVSFLEACFLCKRQLSHSRDIYMYRGDQAFCTEECRYKQIISDEREEKCCLQAIKMRTSASPVQSPDQQRGRMRSGAAVAG